MIEDGYYSPLVPVRCLPRKRIQNCCIDLFSQQAVVAKDNTIYVRHNLNLLASSQNDLSLQSQQQDQAYNFTNHPLTPLRYPLSPIFQSKLRMSFQAFQHYHRHQLHNLTKTININNQNENYFLSFLNHTKSHNLQPQSKFLHHLSIYIQPHNLQFWQKYISYCQHRGQFERGHILAKTAFLFTQSQASMRMYLTLGEKAKTPIVEMKDILSCLNCAQKYDKTILVELAKMHLKTNYSYVKVLSAVCRWNNFRTQVGGIVLFLTKYLENISFRDKAMELLRYTMKQRIPKVQIHLLYLQMSIRGGNRVESAIKEVMQSYQYVANQNKYKVYLQIAEIYYRLYNDCQSYKLYMIKAYDTAEQYKQNKALRYIYYHIAKTLSLPSNVSQGDIPSFEMNRHTFIQDSIMKEYQFQEWMYYLHYGLTKDLNLLKSICDKHPFTGRLIAQYMHCLRQSVTAIEALQQWSKKITLIPKSGQLLTEGGRIYADMGNYTAAIQCFNNAIHYTPQYGDSYIELLRLLLIKGNYHAIQLLKRSMFVNQPYYGYAWNYIQNSSKQILCLKQIWKLAEANIKEQLYHQSAQQYPMRHWVKQQTAFIPYNQAYRHMKTKQERSILFRGYQKIDNRN